MENIVINGLLYKCRNGTNKKISELLHKGDKAPAIEHERGTAYSEYNDFLWSIIDNVTGIYLENSYNTM